MLRRQLLASTALIPVAACGGLPSIVSTVDPALGKAIGYIDAISIGITDVLPAVQKILPTNAMTEIEKWLGIITAGADTVKSAGSIVAAGSVGSSILTAATSILNVIGVALPPPYNLILPAVEAVLPGIASIFGLGSPTKSRHATARTVPPEAAASMLRDIHVSLRRVP